MRGSAAFEQSKNLDRFKGMNEVRGLIYVKVS